VEPPETINAGDLVLKRWELEWAEQAVAAIQASLPELREFLPWATDDPSVEDSREFIQRSNDDWVEGTQFNYAIFDQAGELVGSIGLTTRMGPGVMEIGYWLGTASTGRGYMTAAVEAATRAALVLPGIERVAIRHDVANLRSGAVAERAGFIEVERRRRDPMAPGHTGTEIVRERRS
jgi:ribosomal-protein-serine acetyltransferase